ncbi:hypothetical protein Purlil1_13530 [Purpureocillium lilacinum]|uniref:Alpha/beta hydrolase fold-3 domain-containing protein n=1 Tax=Purpureocillium lilacinum TaxID=33203 RepID=A0ABR0BDR8_PURLI|nr:hypothetical protein Purlil1_13530 [Purpureocillium lilacinum]
MTQRFELVVDCVLDCIGSWLKWRSAHTTFTNTHGPAVTAMWGRLNPGQRRFFMECFDCRTISEPGAYVTSNPPSSGESVGSSRTRCFVVSSSTDPCMEPAKMSHSSSPGAEAQDTALVSDTDRGQRGDDEETLLVVFLTPCYGLTVRGWLEIAAVGSASYQLTVYQPRLDAPFHLLGKEHVICPQGLCPPLRHQGESTDRSMCGEQGSGSSCLPSNQNSQHEDSDGHRRKTLQIKPRWQLAARAWVIQSAATLAFRYMNRRSPPVTKTIWIDSTLGPWKGKGKIRVDIWEPPLTRAPDSRKSRPALINFHGGGFVLGRATDDARWISAAAVALDAVVFSVNYRLAPRYPFPTAVEDCADSIIYIHNHAEQLGVDINCIMVGRKSVYLAPGRILLFPRP